MCEIRVELAGASKNLLRLRGSVHRHQHMATSGFFFFQAEDGIRDLIVTGVHTCALPIYPGGDPRTRQLTVTRCRNRRRGAGSRRDRSEERREGTEGRIRWSAELAKN